MTNLERAKQFLPFDALKGFYRMIKKTEFIDEGKKELIDDGVKMLEEKLNQLKKGMMVKIIFFDNNHYELKEGLISRLDKTFNTITIVKDTIAISDIYDIYFEEMETNDCVSA